MLTVLMGRAKTGKSDTVLYRIADLGDTGKQILLVPEHASHQAEIDLCRICGDTASRHAEVLSFRRPCPGVPGRRRQAAPAAKDPGYRGSGHEGVPASLPEIHLSAKAAGPVR